MNIAVFADVHGHIALCFKLSARWEAETGQKIDLILQAGDLGVFPDLSRLDKATRRHAERNPDELGFATDFASDKPEIRSLLENTSAPMIFVRGNHEDQRWLDKREKQSRDALFSIDAYQRIFCLKTGVIYEHTCADESMSVLGIGRIGAGRTSRHVIDGNIQPYEQKRLYHLPHQQVDILLTHDSALDFVSTGYGMKEIRQALDHFRPIYHLHGHVGGPYWQAMDDNGKTITIKMTDLTWAKSRTLQPGAMGILRWQGQKEHSFEVVEDGWLAEYTAHNWRFIE